MKSRSILASLFGALILFSMATPAMAWTDGETMSEDATVSVPRWFVSPDGRLMAYATSDGGTDWKTWHVRNVDTGEDLADYLDGTKFANVSWDRDSQGFYYSRYPKGESGVGPLRGLPRRSPLRNPGVGTID